MTLHVFGPGGPYQPISECARAYGRISGIDIEVEMGIPGEWIDRARDDADIIYGGAEYMMSDFIAAYPGIVDEATVTILHSREVGIIVRPGNPRAVKTLSDLGRADVRTLNVELEDMETLQMRGPATISLSVLTGKEGFELWPSRPDIDAWVTYYSWHVALKDSSDFVHLPDCESIVRATPAAIASLSKQKDEAAAFIDFMRSETGYEIFRARGWK